LKGWDELSPDHGASFFEAASEELKLSIGNTLQHWQYMIVRARPDLATLIDVSKAGDGSDRHGVEGITLSY
jgi:hypothetical protein